MSLDLDDTLWPMGPVIVTAERVLLAWLTTHCPLAMVGHDIDSMRLLRAHSAAEFPARVHDMTFLRRHALARQITAAGYPESMADEALQVFMVERNRVELYADVLPALSRLRLRYRLFALSNGNADLRRCGIDALFDGHVNAIDAGVGKPDARIFAHLSRLAVRAGQWLRAGDLGGRVGSTGRSTGAHLHYETRIDGEPVDPQGFLDAGRALAEDAEP